MPRAFSFEKAIVQCAEEHKGRYAYPSAVAKFARDKIAIVCPIHGEFHQRLDHHKAGRGCPACRADNIRRPLPTSVTECAKAHQGFYHYPPQPFCGNKGRLRVICPIHGEFSQRLSRHRAGMGCQKCANHKIAVSRRLTTAEFLQKARTAHGDRYGYSAVRYVNSTQQVEISCKEHGVFRMKPANHTQGKGCPRCAKYGFDVDGPAVFYCLEAVSGGAIKYGVTKNFKRRKYELAKNTPFGFGVVFVLPTEGRTALAFEKQALAGGESAGFKGFDGATEWVTPLYYSE